MEKLTYAALVIFFTLIGVAFYLDYRKNKRKENKRIYNDFES